MEFETISLEEVEQLRKEQRKRGYAEKVVKAYADADFEPVIAAFKVSDVTSGTQATAKSVLNSAIKKLKLEDTLNVIMLKDEEKIALSASVS